MTLLLNLHALFTAIVFANLSTRCSAQLSGRDFCSTPAPDESLRAEHRRLYDLQAQRGSTAEESREVVSMIEIETWFHIVSSNEASNAVSDDMITSQLSYLQKAYESATISYRLEGITRHINDSWARNDDELGMKNALRRGNYSTLNVYFQTDLQASSDDTSRGFPYNGNRRTDVSGQSSTTVLGFCTLPDPSVNSSSPRSSYIKDGCNVLADTMPGGSLAQYNQGGTAVHEVGHWNGLLHTFEGESCSPDNEGDYIDDTPEQSEPTSGCPAEKDSCPDLPGLDAIHNFMDYSSDDCYESFTPDQAERMRSMWSAMREGK
ncbi:metalloprotease MEP1 [Aspergillus piperis CBS 112811]|uniref:Metalloprotease MEP1 n=1 Tax=Aspergillus piperis CBS 112811 TaxID=1448313 RepID=A0A8G1QW97_9EURO|nr:metalloprotease MEP1 [Aspergillus piperis CBS 112811]RAH55571.1 metalloprotease MEP1 [Aspergillus piperis CBS 112811]